LTIQNQYQRISFSEITGKVGEEPGIYEIWTESGSRLKVGISQNLRKRLKQHAASRESGLKNLCSNPKKPADITSKASILAKHLYFDRALPEAMGYDLCSGDERKKFLAEKCYIKFLVTKTRDEARKLEIEMEKTGEFRYTRKVQIIEKS
jgi:excinuclease UvrABC nuclease subunit